VPFIWLNSLQLGREDLWPGRWEVVSRPAKIGMNLSGIAVLALLIAEHNTWLADRGLGGFVTIVQDFPTQLI